MERTVSASHARVRLGELLRVVAEQDEAILIERSGTPQAVLISIAAYERLKERSDPWAVAWEKVQRARELARLEGGGRPLHPTPEDVLRQLREERDEQLLSGLPGFESCRPLGDGTEQ